MSEICTECLKGKLVPQGGAGRLFTYRRGSSYELPEDFLVPTCEACGADFLDDALEEAARELLKPRYLEDQKRHIAYLVETIRAAASVTNRELEKACGVTPTYLSHLLKGRKEASEPLIGLLESYAIHPEEVRRRLSRRSAHDTDSVKQVVAEEVAWGEPTHWEPPEYDAEFRMEPANGARAA